MKTMKEPYQTSHQIAVNPYEGEGPDALSDHTIPKIWSARKCARRILKVVSLRRKTVRAQEINYQQHLVWLFDNIAYKPSGQLPTELGGQDKVWKAQMIACVFDREHHDRGQSIARIADFVGIDGKVGQDPAIRQRIIQRLQSLLYTVTPNRNLTVDMDLLSDGIQKFAVGPTDRNGIIDQPVSLHSSQVTDGSVITSHLAGAASNVVMQTRFAYPEGWLLISDIDDSIKVTLTSDTVGILRTTFVNDPEPIAGMPALYQHIERELKPTWVYISASPYNLYQFLRAFLHSFYPPGMLMLRETSWKDVGEFAKSYNTGTKMYKVHKIEKVHSWLPARKVICIGDSTQGDPEAYAEIYRRHEGWIRAIFIRKVTNVPHMRKKNSEERFQMAFRGVPKDVWSVFEQPNDLYESIAKLKLEE